MAFVVARKAVNTAPDRPKVWHYWTGKDWLQDVSRAERHETRGAALVAHARLVTGAYPAGGSPVVVERP
jgi:hypothetical protein